MTQYDEDMLQEINDKVDLLEYAGHNIQLTQRGKDYFGKCPLHIDNTPSFSITPSKNKYFCFGCGRGGQIIKYLMDYENLNYNAAIKKACDLAHVNIGACCQSETLKFNKRTRELHNHKNVTQEHLILAETEFLKYKIAEVAVWLNEGIRQQEMELFGIRMDARSNRIVYAVRDIDGNLINIKGRTLFPDYKKMGISKYINYFKVGVVDYIQGLNITLPYVKKSGEIKIFESIKSVMKLFGHNVKDSGSAEKHTLTKEQIILLIQLEVDVVFCYDSDISYENKEIRKNINLLKKYTNVYIIEDTANLLGGEKGKNSPIDKGIDIWNILYSKRKKVI